MRTRLVGAVLLMTMLACGAPKKPDGGTGGFGGFGGFGGGSAGGSAGGSGGGSTLETISITVVETPAGVPVDGAAIRLSGPGAISQGTTNDAGVAHIALPPNERPLDITIAKAGYGALSVLGVDGTAPARMRIDRFAQPNFTTASASGTITGKQGASNEVVIDAYMFNTFRGPMASYATTYATSSAPWPLEMVALELDPNENVVSYVLSQAFPRGAAVAWSVMFPLTPPVIRGVDHTLEFPTQGLLKLPMQDVASPQVSRQSPDNSGNWVMSGSMARRTPSGSSIPLHLTSVEGRFLPDRAYLWLSEPVARTTLVTVIHDPMDNPRTITLPQVTSLQLTGTKLADVAASATTAPGFDVLMLSVGLQATQEVPSWRVYTMKGKPFTIATLPNLPSGITPADLNITGQVDALAMLIAFEDPGALPWMLQASEHSQPQYKLTFSYGYTTIAPTWR